MAAAKPDSIFEIGSITKTFTGLLLARMVAEGSVRFDEPVRELLPAGTVPGPMGWRSPCRIWRLNTPDCRGMPDNFKPADMRNPYADYHARDLYAYMAKHGVAKPAQAPFFYSNLGLGTARSGPGQPRWHNLRDHCESQITGPLGMPDTVVSVSPESSGSASYRATAATRP